LSGGRFCTQAQFTFSSENEKKKGFVKSVHAFHSATATHKQLITNGI